VQQLAFRHASICCSQPKQFLLLSLINATVEMCAGESVSSFAYQTLRMKSVSGRLQVVMPKG
jgi:hypothetical protein